MILIGMPNNHSPQLQQTLSTVVAAGHQPLDRLLSPQNIREVVAQPPCPFLPFVPFAVLIYHRAHHRTGSGIPGTASSLQLR